jgi:hypothetical protein
MTLIIKYPFPQESTEALPMPTTFNIPSSDPALLSSATRVGEDFARETLREGIVGIVFLGALARGYFDTFADIDVILYRAPGSPLTLPASYIPREGFEIHCDMLDYTQEVSQPWDMAKRWAYTSHKIFYDPSGLLARLFAEKLTLQPAERRWLMIEGMTQSNWYCDTLPHLWLARGDLLSAQHMFHEGITHFFNALCGLNNELVADVKWRFYSVSRLPILPPRFEEMIQEVLSVRAFSAEDIDRRRQAFMQMWQAVLPLVEEEVQMKYEEFAKLV